MHLASTDGYRSSMEHTSDLCRSHCPINFVLETFGDKWTLLVIRDLMFHGKRYYGEFLDSDERISTNILADRLRRLERHGVIRRETDPQNRSRVMYRLTEKGKDLLPVMLAITEWSGRYDAKTNVPRPFLKSLEKDRRRLMARIRANLADPE